VEERASWSRTWRYVVGIGACLVLGWFAFVRAAPVPMLSLVDLGMHELGHLVTYVFPDLITAVAGSAFQILVPVGLAAYFWLAGRDRLAAGLCLAWSATAAQQVAVYVADAPFQRLQLLGGDHEWAFVLGRLGILDGADELAAEIRLLGFLLLLAGLGMCLWGLARSRSDSVPRTAPPEAWEPVSR
jgi:hypothetical protein